MDVPNLRAALGQFATGVTIVTASRSDGKPVGVTANSFNSVSLEPPMVIWSLCEKARSRRTFERAEHFCVHVLAAEQRTLSERFARAGADKFAGIRWSGGIGDVPLLAEYAARFQCRTTDCRPVGDHVVFIGEVLDFDNTGRRPLVFYAGNYAMAERRRFDKAARHGPAGHPADRRKPIL